MGSKANYTKLIEERKELEERTQRLVLDKLSYLRGVGRSVMTKCHGGWSWETEELSYLGAVGYWLRTGTMRLVRLEEFYIVFTHPSFTAKMPQAELKIPRAYLHMSDRDFAKEIRGKVAARKAHLRKVEVYEAEENLKRAKLEIEKQQKEVQRLEKLVEIAKASQERAKETK